MIESIKQVKDGKDLLTSSLLLNHKHAKKSPLLLAVLEMNPFNATSCILVV